MPLTAKVSVHRTAIRWISDHLYDRITQHDRLLYTNSPTNTFFVLSSLYVLYFFPPLPPFLGSFFFCCSGFRVAK
ncbi:hypothetical protein LY78DRAFT_242839 [Colletotrichum sublineola]|nr:hypothetical protein LY78DRAFT_242839 [Colletotrichum sublineola]